MPFVSGFLRTRRGGGEIDNTLPPGSGGEIDNALPGGGGGWIDNELPAPPGIWPPIQLPPDYPMPPGAIWPPVHPPVAGHPLPHPPGHPDAGLPPAPGRPDAGLPSPQPPRPPTIGGGPVVPSSKFLVAIVALSAAGPKVIGYTVVDPSLVVGYPLPNPPGGVVSPPIAPTPEPKRG
jgi:hypothetical protein